MKFNVCLPGALSILFSVTFLAAEEPSASPSPFLAKPSPSPELAPSASSAAPFHNDEAALHCKVLELAGAFSNGGYKIRDGYFFALLPEKENSLLLVVNLFAGNQYWFCAAATSSVRKIRLNLYDEEGKWLPTQQYAEGATAAAGLEPSHSGKYFVRLELLEGNRSDFCLLYTYK